MIAQKRNSKRMLAEQLPAAKRLNQTICRNARRSKLKIHFRKTSNMITCFTGFYLFRSSNTSKSTTISVDGGSTKHARLCTDHFNVCAFCAALCPGAKKINTVLLIRHLRHGLACERASQQLLPTISQQRLQPGSIQNQVGLHDMPLKYEMLSAYSLQCPNTHVKLCKPAGIKKY